MIDANNLKFGDVVYCVNEHNNAFSKQKIIMIDTNGIEWFRYDRDHWEYSISELVLCGRVTVSIEGEVDIDSDRQNQLHFKYPDGNIYYEYSNDICNIEEWFHTRAEAEEHAEKMKQKRVE